MEMVLLVVMIGGVLSIIDKQQQYSRQLKAIRIRDQRVLRESDKR